jgi:hypothetical protein
MQHSDLSGQTIFILSGMAWYGAKHFTLDPAVLSRLTIFILAKCVSKFTVEYFIFSFSKARLGFI